MISLLLDGGQSGIRARIVNASGTRLADYELGPIVTDRAVLGQISAAVHELHRSSGKHFDMVAAGVSGLTAAETDIDAVLANVAPTGVRRLVIAHDSVSGYLSAVGDRFGVTVGVGTGVFVRAVGPAGTARVDGWGYLLGDAGSAFWIGRAALDAAMRSFDGRGPSTHLLALVRQRYGEPSDAYMKVQADPERVRTIAALAQDVDALAADGDRVACDILCAAGRELASSTTTALRRAGLEGAVTVAWLGNVMRSALVRDSMTAGVKSEFPDAVFLERTVDPLDGVAQLLELSEGHPLIEAALRAEVR